MEMNWNKYTPGENTMIITTLDAHTAGEPLRIVTGGMPELPGATILARRRYMQEHYDHIRKALMWEPRGHYNMYGCILTPPVTPGADLGVLFMHAATFVSLPMAKWIVRPLAPAFLRAWLCITQRAK